MSKIIKSKYKKSRALGVSIWGNEKDSFYKRNYPPGQHFNKKGAFGKKKSDYGLHLQAKQKIKAHYGRVGEKQFKNIFKLAKEMKGNTERNFLGLLESRLDVIVYRLNFAPTIFAARQIVSHKHVKVNGKKVNIPSMRVAEGSTIEVVKNIQQVSIVHESVARLSRNVPSYLILDSENFKGQFLRKPEVTDVPFPFDPELQKIVELYSK